MRKRKTKRTPDSATSAFTHTNRRGHTYYLHEGRTKKGNPRYFFAKSVGEGALADMPDGYEVSESINAVVSVRRKNPRRDLISATDFQAVQGELKRYPHLRHHRVRADGDAIVIHEPDTRPEDLLQLESIFGLGGPSQALIEFKMARTRYSPVMKFEQQSDGYAVYRMTYRGHGGWSYPLDGGKLDTLVRKYVRHIGTHEFFDLM